MTEETFKEKVVKRMTIKELVEELGKRDSVEKRQIKAYEDILIGDEMYTGPIMLLITID